MNNDEKPWYSLKETATALNVNIDILLRKITFLNFETTPLPGTKEEYLSASDFRELQAMIRPQQDTPVA